MNELEGRVVLHRCFEAAGYSITQDYPLTYGGVTVSLDGYDAAARVGYEFITTEAGDREEFSPHVVAVLENAMRRGEFRVFLVDEREVDEVSLTAAALRFLDAVKTERNAP